LTKQPRKRVASEKAEIGWHESVGLPELGVAALHAKIDTGARTSALHAVDIEAFERDGAPWVSFHIPVPGEPRKKRCSAPVLGRRDIKNTSGESESRFIIATTLVLGRRRWHIEVSLADREKMEFDLILGRTAIRRHGYLVNPGKSFLAGPPTDRRSKSKARSSESARQAAPRDFEVARYEANEGEEE
jgi:hypothetical protein